jgi:hypothetical protein
MSEVLQQRLRKALELTDSLAAGLADTHLALRNGTARSNTIAEQFWCLAGARESYARALAAGTWQGFGCTLTRQDLASADALRAGLSRAAEQVRRRLADIVAPNEPQQILLIDLLEHEAQHHGQLIRYFYANDLTFPDAFAARHSL